MYVKFLLNYFNKIKFSTVFLSTFDIFTLLLDNGADIHKQDNFGFIAIELAILRRNRDCVITLMKRGSNLYKLTPYSKNTILKLAQERMSDILPAVRSNNNQSDLKIFSKTKILNT